MFSAEESLLLKQGERDVAQERGDALSGGEVEHRLGVVVLEGLSKGAREQVEGCDERSESD